MYRTSNGGAKANVHSPGSTVSSSGPERPAYALVLVPEVGIDGDLALRALLKAAKRAYGLRCTRHHRLPVTSVSSVAW